MAQEKLLNQSNLLAFDATYYFTVNVHTVKFATIDKTTQLTDQIKRVVLLMLMVLFKYICIFKFNGVPE